MRCAASSPAIHSLRARLLQGLEGAAIADRLFAPAGTELDAVALLAA
jgi:hypothetical protein